MEKSKIKPKFVPQSGKIYRIILHGKANIDWEVGCDVRYSLYTRKVSDSYTWDRNANKYLIVKRSNGTWDIRQFYGKSPCYPIYISTEHCNGWYIKMAHNEDKGVDWGGDVNGWRFENVEYDPSLVHLNCGQYTAWHSTHTGDAGRTWFLKGVGKEKKWQ